MRFDDLRLAEPILRAVRTEGYTLPTPIQMAAIPPVLEGRDVLGCAQTGTGKTAAFALPILQRLCAAVPPVHRTGRPIRVLILAPTRELAAQIDDSFRTYGRHTPLRHTVIFGGVNQNPQARALRDGVDVVVATPGRLMDLMQQGLVDLRRVEVLVLDEADQMLDMGFIRDIRKIIAKVPARRQTLMFSATMPAEIRALADDILQQPVSVNVAPMTIAAETVEQAVYFVERRNKPTMLQCFLNGNAIKRALVFTRTKRGADLVVRHLSQAGIHAEAIHGNKSQNARDRAMRKFKSDAPPVLVATDIAARGLDIDEVSHVINYDVPNVPETYVHRIGRTGRAGATGLALSFCDTEERAYLRDIERLIRKPIPVSPDSPVPAVLTSRPATQRPHPQQAANPRFRPRQQQRHTGQRTHHEASAAPQARQAEPRQTSTEQPKAMPAGVGYHSRGRSRRRRGAGRGAPVAGRRSR